MRKWLALAVLVLASGDALGQGMCRADRDYRLLSETTWHPCVPMDPVSAAAINANTSLYTYRLHVTAGPTPTATPSPRPTAPPPPTPTPGPTPPPAPTPGPPAPTPGPIGTPCPSGVTGLLIEWYFSPAVQTALQPDWRNMPSGETLKFRNGSPALVTISGAPNLSSADFYIVKK